MNFGKILKKYYFCHLKNRSSSIGLPQSFISGNIISGTVDCQID